MNQQSGQLERGCTSVKRIVILSSADPRIKRGLQVVALTHAKSMRKYGLDAVIFCPSEKYEAYELEGVPVYTFAFTKGRYSALNFVKMMVACWRGWTKHFGEKEPDVLHGHDPMTYYFLSQYLSQNVRKIFTVHDPFIYHHRMLGTLPSGMSLKEKMMTHIENMDYAKSAKIHCISEYTRIRIVNRESLKEKIRIVPDWIDMDLFVLPADRSSVRTELAIAPHEFIIYTLRGLQARMGLGNLIQAFSQLSARLPHARLIIGGKGALRSELERQAQELGVAGRVTFLGYVPDAEVVKRYQVADVVIMPSLDGEGFGLPVLEAMACGTPVLATPVCALPEVLHGKRERLFSGIDPEDIASGILKFHQLWQEGKINANAERNYVLEHYSEAVILRTILDDFGV